jgi:hypothetical protein
MCRDKLMANVTSATRVRETTDMLNTACAYSSSAATTGRLFANQHAGINQPAASSWRERFTQLFGRC